ncbi:PA domain-containing protein [Chitinivorax sp. B]|uniref:PA domain-containing protein n=1 Tax=Chitinivorax sp. B TaxID=2502235 RepID=UPI0010F91D7D|nr:PA domain-containing protein [Chitinivorax sp. B]
MIIKRCVLCVSTALACLAIPTMASAAAQIIIVNADGPGEGFNDPTPVAPIGGNAGTTLGQQRLNAFQAAADLWGKKLNSSVPIRIQSNFDPLECDKDSATLGSAGPLEVGADFPGAPKRNTWYHGALVNKLLGQDDFDGQPVIRARFNSNLGQENCLAGGGFYLGLDGNHDKLTDLVGVLLHEFGHGLGFSNLTNGQTGKQLNGKPSAWDHLLLDTSNNKRWSNMTTSERVASGTNARKLVWTGSNVTREASKVLSKGVPELRVTSPSLISGNYLAGPADFGPKLTAQGLAGTVAGFADQADGKGLACDAISSGNAALLIGKIALIDRGNCNFTTKVKNAQVAGAVGVIVVDNTPGSPPPGLVGSDETVTIPSIRITQQDGDKLKSSLNSGRTLRVTLGLNTKQYAGADLVGRVQMYTPNPYQPGSSVSHFDTLASPNLLMEPHNTDEVKRSVDSPQDLTYPLLRDIGW